MLLNVHQDRNFTSLRVRDELYSSHGFISPQKFLRFCSRL